MTESVTALRRVQYETSLELKRYQDLSQQVTGQLSRVQRELQVQGEELMVAVRTTEQFRGMASAFSHFADAIWHRIEERLESRVRGIVEAMQKRMIQKTE